MSVTKKAEHRNVILSITDQLVQIKISLEVFLTRPI